MIRNPIFRWGLLFAVFALLGFVYEYHLPKFESYLLVKLEELSKEHAPVKVWAKRLRFRLITLSVVLEDVQVVPKKELSQYFATTKLKEVGARLALIPLLRGEIRLGQIYIRKSNINLFLNSELFQKKGGEDFNLDTLYALPIDEIRLEEIQLTGRLSPQNVVFRISDLNLSLENRFRSLYLDIQTPHALVKPSGRDIPLRVQLELRTLIEENLLNIAAFKLMADQSTVVASGRLNGKVLDGKFTKGSVEARAKILTNHINLWESVFVVNPQLPKFQGTAELSSVIEIKSPNDIRLNQGIKTEDFKIDKYLVGNINGSFQTNFETIVSDKIEITNKSGLAQVEQLILKLGKTPSVSGKVSTKKLWLAPFLSTLDVNGVPVELPIDATLNCQGTWSEKKQIDCQGGLQADKLRVFNEDNNSTIVETGHLKATGSVRVDTQEVEYRGELEVGKLSKGRSHGKIHYDKGFKIFYEGDRLAFSDVKNLVNLKFEGEAKVKGSTEGTASWATVDMNVKASKFWLEDYPLGELSGNLKYKKGHLLLNPMEGTWGVTRYAGDVDIDLVKDRLKLKANIPFVNLDDVKSMFQRHYNIPVEAAGTGTGYLEAEGPFRFQDLTYKIRSSFYRGHIAKETYDNLIFNIRSDKGLVQSEKIHLTKASGAVEVKGQISPKGEIDTVFVGRGLRLEQSENVFALGFDVQGLADLTMLVRGQLSKPQIELNGRFTKMILADQAAGDSAFKLDFLSDRVAGSGQFLGGKLTSDFIIPYSEQGPFRFKLNADKWDFAILNVLTSKASRRLDFETSVSFNVDLAAPTGGFWASSGQVRVRDFLLRKGNQSMTAPRPLNINVQNGVANTSDFVISSGDSYLKLEAHQFSRNNFNASLNGKMDVGLLGVFTPYISDLRGNMAISMDLRGNLSKPQLSGSAYIDKGYAKFVDFLHPFSNVRGDVIFNGNQILINSTQADLAGGRVMGDGRVTFSGGQRIVDVKGNFSDVRANIPENFRTRGSGSVAIYGNQFPYTMAVNYNVTGGEITYEIGEESDDSGVKASAYLPRFLNPDDFHPFTFLLDIRLKNPVSVNNALMQAQVTGQVRVNGTPDRLLLTGAFTPLAGAKVFFHNVPFDVTSAFFEYSNAPPNSPKVQLTATTQITETARDEQRGGNYESQYEINMLIQGRGPNPQIILTSQPSLSQQEIVSLLALGVTNTGMEDRALGVQATDTSTALGTVLLQKAGGRRLKDTLGLDFKVSQSQPTPDTASSPKVTLSKQLTPNFTASASSTVQSNPANSVKLEYKMNRNLSVIGSFDGKENVPLQKDVKQNVLGLDLEYKVQFK